MVAAENGTKVGPEPPAATSPGEALGWALLLLPIFPALIIAMIYVDYTMGHLYVALAIIEEHDHGEDDWYDQQGHYSDDPMDSLDDDPALNLADLGHMADQRHDGYILRPDPPINSLRSTARRLHGLLGWLASFRGFFVFCVTYSFHIGIYFIFLTATSPETATEDLSMVNLSQIFNSLPGLGITLALAPLTTHWVHTIVTAPSPFDVSNILSHVGSLRSLRFLFMGMSTISYLIKQAFNGLMGRLPLFWRTFQATAVPIILHWAASSVADWIDRHTNQFLGLDPIKLALGLESVWRSTMALAIHCITHLILVLPTQILLFRIQASLLPDDASPIIPFRHAFGRLIEPRRFGGRGYLSMSDAWRSVSRPSHRLASLYIKVSIIQRLFYLIQAALIPAIFATLPRRNAEPAV